MSEGWQAQRPQRAAQEIQWFLTDTGRAFWSFSVLEARLNDMSKQATRADDIARLTLTPKVKRAALVDDIHQAASYVKENSRGFSRWEKDTEARICNDGGGGLPRKMT
jgi:hypothetical protein